MEGEFEDLNILTISDLEQEKNRLSWKIFEIFTSETPVYLIFINIKSELDDFKEKNHISDLF